MFILLFLFWILINGKITLELVIFGLIISFAVYMFSCFFLNFSFKKDICLMKSLPLLISFMALLVIEVVKSNLNIVGVILKNKTPEPAIATFNVGLKSNFLRVLYANSITLTPGTITISLTENEIVVHALRHEYLDGIDNSKLLKILMKMEGYLQWM